MQLSVATFVLRKVLLYQEFLKTTSILGFLYFSISLLGRWCRKAANEVFALWLHNQGCFIPLIRRYATPSPLRGEGK
jgi:hypothetical protein